MRGESRAAARLIHTLWLAASFASTAIAQGVATTPVVRAFFDGAARAAVFLVECRNPSGTPIDRFDNRWMRDYRIDGVEPAPHGYASSISGGPFAPIAADGLWRGTVELVQPNGVSRTSTEANRSLGILANFAIAHVITPGRHTIAVQCFDTWSDELAFSWPPRPSPKTEIGSLIAPLVKLTDVAPRYPADARATHVEGTVIVEATIGVDGTITPVRVTRSIPLLNQAALDAVRQWRCRSISRSLHSSLMSLHSARKRSRTGRKSLAVSPNAIDGRTEATVHVRKVIAAAAEATDEHPDRDFPSRWSGFPASGSD